MRRVALRRVPMRRGTRRVGQAARERVRAGGVLAKGRESATLAAWRALVADLTERCDGRCENPLCRRRGPVEPHHICRRSQGGSDDPNGIVMLCRACHEATEAAFARGRLLVEPLGFGLFRFRREVRTWKGRPLLSSTQAIYARRGADHATTARCP